MTASTQSGAASVHVLQKLLTTILGTARPTHEEMFFTVSDDHHLRSQGVHDFGDLSDDALAAADLESFTISADDAVLPRSTDSSRPTIDHRDAPVLDDLHAALAHSEVASSLAEGVSSERAPAVMPAAKKRSFFWQGAQQHLAANRDAPLSAAGRRDADLMSREQCAVENIHADAGEDYVRSPQEQGADALEINHNERCVDGNEAIATYLIDSWGEAKVGITRVGNPAGDPVLMLAGIGGHSGLFWSVSEPGLAGFLVEQGFCCYLIDLDKKGVCGQLTAANELHEETAEGGGLFNWVTQDIPAVVSWVAERHPDHAQRWVGHGAGGLVWWALWARYPEFRTHCSAIMQVATARTTALVQKPADAVRLSKRTRFNWWLSQRGLVQRFMGPKGEVPLRELGLGVANESQQVFNQWLAWCDGSDWVDPVDGFAYGDVIRHAQSQPYCSCWVAEQGVCATETSVRALMGTLRLQNPRLFVIKEPFDNVTLLTGPNAVQNHFPSMLNWLNLGRKQTDVSPQQTAGRAQRA